MTQYLLPVLAALVVFVGYMLLSTMAARKGTVRERMLRMVPHIEGGGESEVALSLEHDKSSFARAIEAVIGVLGINVEKFVDENELRFYQAGIYTPNAPAYYLFAKYVGLTLGMLLLFFIYLKVMKIAGLIKAVWIIMGVIVFICALKGPDLFITNKRQKHAKILERSFPDSLDLLLVCVESGLALDGALARVCKELGRAHPALTRELNRTRMELTLLNDRSKALQNLAERTDLVPFRSLVATLMQTEKFGTSLTETLRVLSEDYRMTRLMKAENKAGRLPALMTIPLITLMLPAFFLIVMSPAIIRLLDVIANR